MNTTKSNLVRRYKGATRLARGLEKAGVTTIFSLSGNQIMPIYDALIDISARIVHSRHEAAAVYMAEAFARVSGEVGIALVSAAPGFANALGALYPAAMSEVPLLLLSGDSPTSQDRAGAFQAFDQVSAASPFVKASYRLCPGDDPAQIVSAAIRLARGGIPGPVHLALPFDLMTAETDGVVADAAVTPVLKHQPIAPTNDQIDAIVEELAASARPLILVGPYLSRARNGDLCKSLSAVLRVPVIALDSPRGLKDPALGAVTELLNVADCIFYLGQAVDFRSGFGADEIISAKKIIAASERCYLLERARKVFAEKSLVVALACPVKVAEVLIDAAVINLDNPKQNRARDKWCSNAYAAMDHRELADDSPEAVYSREIIGHLNRYLSTDQLSILVCDGGEFGQWGQAFGKADVYLNNGPAGSIGASLPYAMGAKIARPDSRVLAISGDGSAGFHLAEFETAVRESLAITFVVGNDSRWNAESLIQARDYGDDRKVGCELSIDARYDRVASGFAANGEFIDDRRQLERVLQQLGENGKPNCINIKIPGVAAPQYTGFRIAL